VCPHICIRLLLVVCVDLTCVCVIAYGVCSACSPAQLMKCKQSKPRAAVTWSMLCCWDRRRGEMLHGVCPFAFVCTCEPLGTACTMEFVRLGGCADRGRLVNKSWSDSESVPQPWRPVRLQLCQRQKEKVKEKGERVEEMFTSVVWNVK